MYEKLHVATATCSHEVHVAYMRSHEVSIMILVSLNPMHGVLDSVKLSEIRKGRGWGGGGVGMNSMKLSKKLKD